jgi:hypothetical protein
LKPLFAGSKDPAYIAGLKTPLRRV